MSVDRVKLAVVSIRKVQDQSSDTPDKFRSIFRLIVDAYKQVDSKRCVICEIVGKPNDASLEKHHVAGRSQWPDALTVCVPCHNLLTEKQKKWQNDIDDSRVRLSSYFNGLSDICELLWEFTCKEYLNSLSKEFTNRAWSIRHSSK